MAQQAGAIIVPLCVTGTNEALPKGAGFFELRFDKEVSVMAGEPIDTSSYDLKQIDKLMSDAHQRIKLMLAEN